MHLLFERYKDRLIRRRRNRGTVVNFTQAARYFEAWCEQRDLDILLVVDQDIEQWMFESRYAATTLRTHWQHIRAAYRMAHAQGLITTFPFYDLEPPSLPDVQPQIISVSQLRDIRERASYKDRDWLLFHLFAYTGCRMSEIRGLRWQDVEMTHNGMQINVLGKGGKRRFVPVHPELQDVLDAADKAHTFVLGSDSPMATRTYYSVLGRIWPDHPEGKSFHAFRRTVGSSLDANGVDERLIEDILGHGKRTVFQKHYRNVADPRLHAAILKLYADCPL